MLNDKVSVNRKTEAFRNPCIRSIFLGLILFVPGILKSKYNYI